VNGAGGQHALFLPDNPGRLNYTSSGIHCGAESLVIHPKTDAPALLQHENKCPVKMSCLDREIPKRAMVVSLVRLRWVVWPHELISVI
jgi:hypothetical protein